MSSSLGSANEIIAGSPLKLAGSTGDMGSTTQAGITERKAASLLASHPHFLGRTRWIRFTVRNKCLYLSGMLPTFYLKQIAQEALRELDGIDRIENRITVANPSGEVPKCHHSQSHWLSRAFAK